MTDAELAKTALRCIYRGNLRAAIVILSILADLEPFGPELWDWPTGPPDVIVDQVDRQGPSFSS